MEIKFVDLPAHHRPLRDEFVKCLDDLIGTGDLTLGRAVDEFEAEFARYCGAHYCLGVANGTDALRLIYEAMGMSRDQDIVTTPNTFFATAEAAFELGVGVRLVDVDPKTWNMDASLLAESISPTTAAVVPVHLYGGPANLNAISEVATRASVPVVEDAAQAHGATYRGRRVGSLGLAGGFSFYAGKNLGALGDAGAVVSNDAALIETVRALRDHGSRNKYQHEVSGWNSRLDSLQAAFLRVKLTHLDEWNKARAQVVEAYRGRLREFDEISWPEAEDGADSVHHLFPILIRSRDRLRALFLQKGIGTGIHYPTPLHLQPACRHLGYSPGDFPVAERIARETISLPVHPFVTEAQVEYVCNTIGEFLSR